MSKMKLSTELEDCVPLDKMNTIYQNNLIKLILITTWKMIIHLLELIFDRTTTWSPVN